MQEGSVWISKKNASKEYECLLCKRVINKGDRYEKTVGKRYGEFYVARHCLKCIDRMTTNIT